MTSASDARRGAAGRVALVVGAVLLGLGFAELMTRLMDAAPALKGIDLSKEDDPEFAYRRSANPLLGFELKPGYRNANPDLLRSYPAINAHGQRDIERAVAKPAGTRRVLMLGDSVVEGMGIRDTDHTLSRRLEALLGKHGIEVLNFGVSGYCTLAEVELLERRGLRFDPDLVLLVFTENDYHNFNRQAFELGPIERRPAAVRSLFKGSHLFRLASWRLNLWGLRDESDPIAWNKAAIGDNNVVVGLERLAALSRKHGFGVLIVVWPRFGTDAIIDPFPSPSGEGRLLIQDIAALHGLPVARLSPGMRLMLKRHGRGMSPQAAFTIGDGLHPSPRGTAVAAELVAQMLDGPKLRLPPPPAPAPGGLGAVAEAARALGKRRKADRTGITYNQAVDLMRAGKEAEALAQFNRVLAQRPDHAGALNNSGILLAKRRDMQGAEARFRRALRAQPGDPEAYNNLAMLLLQRGQVPAGIAMLERSLKIKPDDARIRAMLQRARSMVGKP